jgi:hypothetical protein
MAKFVGPFTDWAVFPENYADKAATFYLFFRVNLTRMPAGLAISQVFLCDNPECKKEGIQLMIPPDSLANLQMPNHFVLIKCHACQRTNCVEQTPRGLSVARISPPGGFPDVPF